MTKNPHQLRHGSAAPTTPPLPVLASSSMAEPAPPQPSALSPPSSEAIPCGGAGAPSPPFPTSAQGGLAIAVPSTTPPLPTSGGRMQMCSKSGCKLLFGSSTEVLPSQAWKAECDSRAGLALENEWDAEHGFSKSAPSGCKCPPWRTLCPERGWCTQSPHAATISEICSAAAKHAKTTIKMGCTVWGLQVKPQHGQWQYASQAPVVCLAHALFNPYRIIVVRMQPVVTPPTSGCLTLPVVVQFQWHRTERLNFELFPHIVAQILSHHNPVGVRLVELDHEPVDWNQELLSQTLRTVDLWPQSQRQPHAGRRVSSVGPVRRGVSREVLHARVQSARARLALMPPAPPPVVEGPVESTPPCPTSPPAPCSTDPPPQVSEVEDEGHEIGESELDGALASQAALAVEEDAWAHTGGSVGHERSCGTQHASAGAPAKWRGFTDNALVSRILEAAGKEPPPPPYRIYERDGRWYARRGGQWVHGSSVLSNRASDEEAVLRVHTVCMADARARGSGMHTSGSARRRRNAGGASRARSSGTSAIRGSANAGEEVSTGGTRGRAAADSEGELSSGHSSEMPFASAVL